MPDAPPTPRPEPLGATIARALVLAALGGVVVGALESLSLLERARYAHWGALLVLVGAGGTALLGAALAIPTALFTRALAGRPEHRAAPPSVCAGLGTIAALVAFVVLRGLPNPLVPAVAFGAALLCLTLRELLAWWPLFGRAGLWWGLAALALSACALRVAAGPAPLATFAAVAAAAGLAAAVMTPVLARRVGHLVAGLMSLGLPLTALLLLTAPPRAEGAPARAELPDVLHVSIDTLRADHVGCYGYEGARTPNIDRLAAEGVLFEEATAQANTTGPSHTTQLTGLFPAEHGAVTNGVPLRHDVATLPEVLRAERGYRTAGFVSGFTMVDEACGLAPRFDWYEDSLLAWRWMPQLCEELAVVSRVAFRLAARRGERVTRSDRPAGETVDRALEWLGRRGEGPAYLFVHFYDPHVPYEPPPELTSAEPEHSWYALPTEERARLVDDPNRRANMVALYDGEIAYADAELGRLLAALDLERTLVIVTSDHGEGLGAHEYFFDHGTFLYDEELHVPLVLRLPGGERGGVRVGGQTRLLDLAPTVLDLLGIESEMRTSGASLVPLLAGPDGVARPSFATAEMGGSFAGFDLGITRLSLRAEGHKLIWTSGHWLDTRRVPARLEVYDLAADPGELSDLALDGQADAALDELRGQLEAWRAATDELRQTGEMSADLTEELRRLGYL